MLFVLTLIAALGCGLIAGVFFAFSSFVMRALSRLPPNEGIAAMQSINVVVINRSFLAAFLGTGVVCLVILVWSFDRWPAPGSAYLAAGSALYLLGTVLVTIAANVPRNEALAKVATTGVGSEASWTNYVRTWTAWNHVRTVAALVAAAFFAMALGR